MKLTQLTQTVGLIALILVFSTNVNSDSEFCDTQNAPNVIVIVTDDQGNADASFNFEMTSPGNKPPIYTPNIDYLANNGIKMKRHYSSNMCVPTRISLMTSRYAFRYGNLFTLPDGLLGLEKINTTTYMQELQKRGYKNYLFGKYGIDNQNRVWNDYVSNWLPSAKSNDDTGPLSRGFHVFYGNYMHAANHFSKKLMDFTDWHYFNTINHTFLDAPYNLNPETNMSSTHIITRETINIINTHCESINVAKLRNIFINVCAHFRNTNKKKRKKNKHKTKQ